MREDYRQAEYHVVTNANGEFEVATSVPSGVGVQTIKKDGFLLKPWASLNITLDPEKEADVGMSPQRPWMIQMWKKQGKSQPLIARDRTFQCGPMVNHLSSAC